MHFSAILKKVAVLVIIVGLAILYKLYSPAEYILFPKCLFRAATGLQCPGCGSQRAIHSLLNFDILNAVKENAILVISIPYLLTGMLFDTIKSNNGSFLKWRKILFGEKAIWGILSKIILFWVVRNIV